MGHKRKEGQCHKVNGQHQCHHHQGQDRGDPIEDLFKGDDSLSGDSDRSEMILETRHPSRWQRTE
jgi:hypothetical protein